MLGNSLFAMTIAVVTSITVVTSIAVHTSCSSDSKDPAASQEGNGPLSLDPLTVADLVGSTLQ